MGEVTGTVNEQDGTLSIKDAAGAEVRYVKESDLLAVKGSREGAVKTAEAAAVADKEAAIAAANTALDTEKTRALQAEAKVTSLEEQISKGVGSAAELAKAQADLVAAKTSSEALGNKFLELKRNTIVTNYKVPVETVASKDLAALEVFEEALKAVLGDKNIGNFAAGGGGGGANALLGKKPMELAVEAYSHTK